MKDQMPSLFDFEDESIFPKPQKEEETPEEKEEKKVNIEEDQAIKEVENKELSATRDITVDDTASEDDAGSQSVEIDEEAQPAYEQPKTKSSGIALETPEASPDKGFMTERHNAGISISLSLPMEPDMPSHEPENVPPETLIETETTNQAPEAPLANTPKIPTGLSLDLPKPEMEEEITSPISDSAEVTSVTIENSNPIEFQPEEPLAEKPFESTVESGEDLKQEEIDLQESEPEEEILVKNSTKELTDAPAQPEEKKEEEQGTASMTKAETPISEEIHLEQPAPEAAEAKERNQPESILDITPSERPEDVEVDTKKKDSRILDSEDTVSEEDDETEIETEGSQSEESTPDLPDWELTKQYYAIGEVAKMFEVNVSHIRFWTKEFKIKTRTTRKGDRLYNPDQIATLRLIHHLVKVKKFTLAGAKEALKSGSDPLQKKLTLQEKLQDLYETLSELRASLD